jgi:hypothetical protein
VDTDVTTKNTAPKAVTGRTLESAQIAVSEVCHRARARIEKPIAIQSLSGDNWQRGRICTRCASKGRRFPTPQPTTSHLFWPNQRRRAVPVLPISLRNSGFSGRRSCRDSGGGRGVQPQEPDNMPRSIRSPGILSPISLPRPIVFTIKKCHATERFLPNRGVVMLSN